MNNNTTPTANDAINRWFLVFFQALATVFLAGATLGWGPMQLVVRVPRGTPCRQSHVKRLSLMVLVVCTVLSLF